MNNSRYSGLRSVLASMIFKEARMKKPIMISPKKIRKPPMAKAILRRASNRTILDHVFPLKDLIFPCSLSPL